MTEFNVNESVEILQAYMGFEGDSIDGLWGGNTSREFTKLLYGVQQQLGISADGWFGDESREAIAAAVEAGTLDAEFGNTLIELYDNGHLNSLHSGRQDNLHEEIRAGTFELTAEDQAEVSALFTVQPEAEPELAEEVVVAPVVTTELTQEFGDTSTLTAPPPIETTELTAPEAHQSFGVTFETGLHYETVALATSLSAYVDDPIPLLEASTEILELQENGDIQGALQLSYETLHSMEPLIPEGSPDTEYFRTQIQSFKEQIHEVAIENGLTITEPAAEIVTAMPSTSIEDIVEQANSLSIVFSTEFTEMSKIAPYHENAEQLTTLLEAGNHEATLEFANNMVQGIKEQVGHMDSALTSYYERLIGDAEESITGYAATHGIELDLDTRAAAPEQLELSSFDPENTSGAFGLAVLHPEKLGIGFTEPQEPTDPALNYNEANAFTFVA